VSLFVDTSGWGYLFDTSNPDLHQRAAQIYQTAKKQNQRLFTSNYVLCELVALLNSPLRMPRAQILQLVSGIKTSNWVHVIHINERLDDLSWQLLQHRVDKQWSLVDCSSFVLMEEHRLTDALTTDHHFQQAGFQPLLSK
jgi:uncharacterized protein